MANYQDKMAEILNTYKCIVLHESIIKQNFVVLFFFLPYIDGKYWVKWWLGTK